MSGPVIQVAHARLEDATTKGDPPGAACCASTRGHVIHESAHGTASVDSVFDLASVTKVVTTLAIATLIRHEHLRLDDAVASHVPAFRHRDVTVRALLGHRSGLPAWRAFFLDAHDRDALLARLFEVELETPGRRVYSDLGFILLGVLIERASDMDLAQYVREHVLAPADLDLTRTAHGLAYRAHELASRHVLPTGVRRPREPAPGQEALYQVDLDAPPHPDPGHVDDDNAFVMGGVAGHAGLFGTARGVATLGARVLDELDGAGPWGMGEILDGFLRLDPADGPPRGLGFDMPSGDTPAAAGLGAGPRGAFGHLGFTGCSLWIDLDRRLSVALLTNRTLEGRQRVAGIRALRPDVHRAIAVHLDPR